MHNALDRHEVVQTHDHRLDSLLGPGSKTDKGNAAASLHQSSHEDELVYTFVRLVSLITAYLNVRLAYTNFFFTTTPPTSSNTLNASGRYGGALG